MMRAVKQTVRAVVLVMLLMAPMMARSEEKLNPVQSLAPGTFIGGSVSSSATFTVPQVLDYDTSAVTFGDSPQSGFPVVPEPSSMILLALGGLALLAKRRGIARSRLARRD